MTTHSCESNIDPINQGTSQDQRVSEQLKPDYVKVDEQKIEHAMVFAKTYAQYLKFYDSNNTVTGNWEAFFSRDVLVQLAKVAIQDVGYYKINIKKSFDFLNNPKYENSENELKNQLGYLFSSIATLAKQLDILKESLPTEIPLKQTLQNLIKNHLASELKKLILYYRDGTIPDEQSQLCLHNVKPEFDIMEAMSTFKGVIEQEELSKDWIFKDQSTNWADYLENLKKFEDYPATKIYGSENKIFKRLNHIATHNQFTAIFDQFLKAFARIVSEAKAELEKKLSDWDKHEPHYALFLAFLKLFDYARAEINTLTQRHLDFYYRDILKLKEKPAEPSHAHLLIELTKHMDAHEFKTGELFSAGKDALGREIFFANQQSFVANQAKITELKTLYRQDFKSKTERLFASPIANSANGLGAKLTTIDQSWHPFVNKIDKDDKSVEIYMPPAEIGFAIASHYLWMAEGNRTLIIEFIPPKDKAIDLTKNNHHIQKIICLVSTDKGWFEKSAEKFVTESGILKLKIKFSAADPAISPYSIKAHDYNFPTNLPILLVKLKDQIYSSLKHIVIEKIDLKVEVTGLKSLALSNDFGAIDTSKPFQPFGALPVANSALIIGSKEIFQKTLSKATININWQNPPNSYNTVNITFDYLQAGQWEPSGITTTNNILDDNITDKSFFLSSGLDKSVIDKPDFSTSETYNTNSKHGFVRLKIDSDFGQSSYEQKLIAYLKKTINEPNSANKKPIPPISPFIAELSLDYTTAKQTIQLNSDQTTFEKLSAKFFHLTPFGHCEQHSLLNSNKEVSLIPQFDNAEFYIGITGLKPPQNLALFFQVADGSADPLVEKPTPHIHWSYLNKNEWHEFKIYEVQDNTHGLINSGIITFAIPDKINSTNTLLPDGQHWLKAAVTEKSEAVCKLLAVSAQSLKVTFQNQNNDSHFLENTLPAESISKLKQPNADVKKVSQPFASFGGRAAEQSLTFYTRVSERLRHKDRCITLWDYEHLILEAFPQIYCVKCLNHTEPEPNADGNGYILNELAPGHITIVTIPNLPFHNRHDPLRPYTSIGLLAEIEAFLEKRSPDFVKLHVKNPIFEEVGVDFKVKFHINIDKDFYKQKLNTAITQFLSPWAFSESSHPTFGGKVYLSTLINFVEEQDYVDYVTNFSFIKPEPAQNLRPDTEITSKDAISILVSAKNHIIKDVASAEDDDSTIKPNELCQSTFP